MGVHSAAVWGGEVRFGDGGCHVAYPCYDDDVLDDMAVSGFFLESAKTLPFRSIEIACSWLLGWVFIADIYRALEDILTKSKTAHQHRLYLSIYITFLQPPHS